MIARLFRWYGAGPRHLFLIVVCFTLVGLGAARLVPTAPSQTLLWFFGALVFHDLVLFPLSSLADGGAQAALGRRARTRELDPALINFVRLPVGLSGLLMLVWFPQILRLSDQRYRASTGLSIDVYLNRWLAITAALFVTSALAYALRRWIRRRRTDGDGLRGRPTSPR